MTGCQTEDPGTRDVGSRGAATAPSPRGHARLKIALQLFRTDMVQQKSTDKAHSTLSAGRETRMVADDSHARKNPAPEKQGGGLVQSRRTQSMSPASTTPHISIGQTAVDPTLRLPISRRWA